MTPFGLSRLDKPLLMSGRSWVRNGLARECGTLRERSPTRSGGRSSLAVGVAAEVKNKLSVVDVVGETVALKKAGTSFKGLCPFHGEKTPSFTVTPGRDSWKCFGCGEG